MKRSTPLRPCRTIHRRLINASTRKSHERLIDNLSQVLTAASINVSNSIENWFPYIDEAQESFIKPVPGNVLNDQLQDLMTITEIVSDKSINNG